MPLWRQKHFKRGHPAPVENQTEFLILTKELKNYIVLQMSPVRLSSKKETSFLISASKSLERKLRPILSEVIPKKESLMKELTAPIHINTTQVTIFLSTSLWSPVRIALIAKPMKFGKKKSVILPKNIKGNPANKIIHYSPKNINNNAHCYYSATLSFGFFGGAFFFVSTVFCFSDFFWGVSFSFLDDSGT